jgi:aconitate hydratase
MSNMKTNFVKSQLDGEFDAVPNTARAYKAAGIKTIVVGIIIMEKVLLENMQQWSPFRCCSCLSKIFARIHETNPSEC